MQPESLELELKSQIPVSQSVLQKLKINSPNVSGKAIEWNPYGFCSIFR